MTDGYTGADLTAIAREAKMVVLKEIIKGNKERKLTFDDMVWALGKIKPSYKDMKTKRSLSHKKVSSTS